MSVTATGSMSLQTSDGLVGNTPLNVVMSGLTFSGVVQEYIPSGQIGLPNPSSLLANVSSTGGTLAAGTYYWVVTALNSNGQTQASNEVTATTSGSTSSAALSWTPVVGAVSYRVWRGTAAGSENTYYATTATSFTDTGATGTSGSLPGSNGTGTTWTPALTQTPVQMMVIKDLSGSNGLQISWTPSGPTGLIGTLSASGGSLAAATYYWVVTALNANGETISSNEVTFTTSGSTSSVVFTWSAVAGATSYRIYRGTVSGSEDHYQTSSVNSFTDTGSVGTAAAPPVSTVLQNVIVLPPGGAIAMFSPTAVSGGGITRLSVSAVPGTTVQALLVA